MNPELGSKFRYKIARILDRLFPDMCWFKLAMWSLFPDDKDFWEILEYRHTTGSCARSGNYNYCGKCDKKYPEASLAECMKRNNQ